MNAVRTDPCRDSPRSRGWTPVRQIFVRRVAGFPALAGMDPRRRRRCRPPRWIPRARGDGPPPPRRCPPGWPDSPRSRGWTRRCLARRAAGGGFPALAGMDPGPDPHRRAAGRIPRARGDGPPPPVAVHDVHRDSPRSRGWTRTEVARGHPGAGFPALAGMDPSRAAFAASAAWIPRARGDGPRGSFSMASAISDSPRSRGWTPLAAPRQGSHVGFPALAGMDPPNSRPGTARPRIPRARGDGPCRAGWMRPSATDSPRSRGWTPMARCFPPGARGFPALAGMDPRHDPWGRSNTWIPRARGDGPREGVLRLLRIEDSPRSRGWTRVGRVGGRGRGGFPALAGMDPSADLLLAIEAGIPRARGDGPLAIADWAQEIPDSPRSRGWTLIDRAADLRVRGFPALAGMDPPCSGSGGIACWIPRARGDGPDHGRGRDIGAKDSPRSRGWTLRARARALGIEGFPALAGMDPWPSPTGPRRSRIPRARGDGPMPVALWHVCQSDSPRSRGWTRGVVAGGAGRMGFPALAGMDPPASSTSAPCSRIPRARGDGPCAR